MFLFHSVPSKTKRKSIFENVVFVFFYLSILSIFDLRISMSEDEHNKLYKDVKKEIKDKYKKKMEKALEEIKATDKLNFEKEIQKLSKEHSERLALELEAKDQQMKVSLQRYEMENDNMNILKQVCVLLTSIEVNFERLYFLFIILNRNRIGTNKNTSIYN